jgi:serine protease Do
VIIALDGKAIEYPAQLQQAVRFKRPGDQVEVTVQRKGGVRKTFRVALVGTENGTPVADNATTERRDRAAAPLQDRLGVAVEAITDREAAGDSAIGASHAGLLVTAVDPDGPAAEKLLPASQTALGADIITHVNGARVKTVADLNTALQDVKPGEVISLQTWVVRRDGSASRIVRLRVK